MAKRQHRTLVESILDDIGRAGSRISDIGASEAAAGNISVYVPGHILIEHVFPEKTSVRLPDPAPALAGGTLLVTGSGRRLREVGDDPQVSVAALHVADDGITATQYTSKKAKFQRLTSEFNSHLAVHNDHVGARDLDFHAVVHAQPMHLTYLSHIPAYRTTMAFNKAILRWEPETIVSLSDGVGVLPFAVPGSAEMGTYNLEGLRQHRIVLWSKHGTMSRSDESVMRAIDLVEYAEAAAHYEVLDLQVGGKAEGITADELSEVATTFSIDSPYL